MGGLCPLFFSADHATIMRLFIAILFLLSASASYAAGITSKTADFVIYKNSLGSSTIPIPNWELVIDGDSLAGKKNLPVPKSSSSFNVKLPLPRGKLVSNLAKFAKLNPYLFIAQGLIDLYFDESRREFMIRGNPAGDPASGVIAEFQSFVDQCFPGNVVTSVCPGPRGERWEVNVKTSNGSFGVHVAYRRYGGDDYGYSVVFPGCSIDHYNTPNHSFNSIRNLPKGWSCINAEQGQLKPATETDIAQSLNKNLTADKLPAVRDLVKSQDWTLETDTTPTVTGPPEVVISTQLKTIQNPDGTTTTQKIVEKAVYTYNNNVITEKVENNVTEISNETSTEPVDYTFQPPSGQYPTDLEIPEKRDLVSEVLNPVASQLQVFGSKIGLRGSGQCSFDIPFSLGRASGSGRLDFCQYQSTFSTLGSMLVAFAYLMAGLIVLGMRH